MLQYTVIPSPNSVNTVCALLFSFALSHDSPAGIVGEGVPWLVCHSFYHHSASKQVMTIVTQLVVLILYICISSPSRFLSVRDQLGRLLKASGVPTAGQPLGLHSFSHSAPTGPSWSTGSEKRDWLRLRDTRDTWGRLRLWAHWTDKPQGFLSDGTLDRLGHGQNREQFNLKLF